MTAFLVLAMVGATGLILLVLAVSRRRGVARSTAPNDSGSAAWIGGGSSDCSPGDAGCDSGGADGGGGGGD